MLSLSTHSDQRNIYYQLVLCQGAGCHASLHHCQRCSEPSIKLFCSVAEPNRRADSANYVADWSVEVYRPLDDEVFDVIQS